MELGTFCGYTSGPASIEAEKLLEKKMKVATDQVQKDLGENKFRQKAKDT